MPAPLRSQLLAGLLDRADAEPRHAHRLRLLIVACLETIPDVPARLRSRLDACLAGLIPPRNSTDTRPLASAGEEVLRRLPASLDGLSTAEAVATVRTTWLINGPGALDRLAAYARDPRGAVQDELITAELLRPARIRRTCSCGRATAAGAAEDRGSRCAPCSAPVA